MGGNLGDREGPSGRVVRAVRSGVVAETPEAGVLANLRYSLQLLAAAAPDQLAHFLPPDFACKADEMALDFDQWVKSVSTYWTLTEDQTTRLTELDAYLDRLSSPQNAAFWTDEVLVSDPRWGQVRVLAQAALTSFHWPKEVPPPEEYSD
jgi:hypothetical protein